MSYSPEERDLAIRTILAEAGSQGIEGQLAVANVIRNRVSSGNYGDGLGGVVTKKYAFEPMLHYGTGRGNDPARFNEGDPAYQQAARILDTTLAGGAPDNTGGATHFIAHRLQGDLGRDTPTWAKGAPLAKIGGHSFYAPEGKIKMDDSTLDPNLVAKLAAGSTNNAGQQAAQMFQQRNGGGAPAGPATAGQFGPLADMFKKMGQGGGMQPPGGGQQTPFLQRMIWGDKGFNGVLGDIKTPNNGQGMFGNMFGGQPTTPPGGPAPQPSGVGAGGTDSLTVPPVTPIESSPLAPPPSMPMPPVRPGLPGADLTSSAAPMVTEAVAPAAAAAAPVAAEAAAAPALAAAAAPAAAAAVPAAAAGAEGLAGLASLFALI